jgi:hypothetical protein
MLSLKREHTGLALHLAARPQALVGPAAWMLEHLPWGNMLSNTVHECDAAPGYTLGDTGCT